MKEPIDESPTLDYESPRDRPVAADKKVFAFLCGFIIATGIVFCANLPFIDFYDGPGPRPQPQRTAAVFCWGLMAVCLVLLICVVKKPAIWPTAWRWAILGALIGAGLMLLLEGACYLMPGLP